MTRKLPPLATPITAADVRPADRHTRQAITTTYHGPTNSRGSRITARCEAARITVEWDHARNPRENHAAAALTLARRLDWRGPWVLGEATDRYTLVAVPHPGHWDTLPPAYLMCCDDDVTGGAK